MAGEVTPRGSGNERRPARELRASHEDRDRVVELLRMAAGDGRLTAEELDQRLEVALTARTYGELTALTSDLPASPALAAAAEPKDLVRVETHSGSARRDGRWVVPKRMEIRVTSGSVRLDFTEAVITQPVLRIDAEVTSGSLTLITKPGIVVDADDVSIRSGTVKVRPPGGPEAPALLSIHVSGKVGSGTIAARPPRPPRRTFWAWLLRRPRPRAITEGS
jgi:Domain of unknown function (DUF1707)